MSDRRRGIDDYGRRSRTDSPYPAEKVAEALRRTGFLLEQDVHALLRTRGHNTFLSSLYLDAEEQVYREMDVTTRDSLPLWGRPTDPSSVSVWRSLIIECKNYATPLVIVGRARSETTMTRVFTEFAASRGVNRARTGGIPSSLGTALGVRSLDASPERASFVGTQIVRLEHRGADFGATNAGLMESLFYPVAKAMVAEQRELTREHEDPHSPTRVVLSFPLVVTSKPVLEADLTSGSPEVREVPRTTVLRRFHRGNEDNGVLPPSILLEVVSRDGLSEYLDQRVDLFTRQVCTAMETHDDLWRPSRGGSARAGS